MSPVHFLMFVCTQFLSRFEKPIELSKRAWSQRQSTWHLRQSKHVGCNGDDIVEGYFEYAESSFLLASCMGCLFSLYFGVYQSPDCYHCFGFSIAAMKNTWLTRKMIDLLLYLQRERTNGEILNLTPMSIKAKRKITTIPIIWPL